MADVTYDPKEASVGLLTRVLYRKKSTSGTTSSYWASESSNPWLPMGRPTSVPSPIGEQNMEDVSTLEDESEIQVPGRNSAASLEFEVTFTKSIFDEIYALKGVTLDIIMLYGRGGVGEKAKFGFKGTASIVPNEASEGHLTATITVAESSTPVLITDDYTVTVLDSQKDEFGYPKEFTVTKVTSGGSGSGGGD